MSKQTLNEMSSSTIRSLSEISETETIHLSVDLVSAARRNIGFLRSVYECQWLHQRATIIEAIRRYDEVWMPLISNLTVEGSTPPMVLPPFDVEWVWFCHTLNPVGYRKYCETRFSKQIGKPAIFNEENEEYALMRCKQIWVQKFSSEPFENEVESDSKNQPLMNKDLFNEVEKHKFLYSKFAEPNLSELVYLIAARQRYKGFLYMMQRFGDGCFRFVPALDILLMLLTHQSYPRVYVEDMKEMWDNMGKLVVGLWETVEEKQVEETKKLWETTFDEPYEKAGGGIAVGMEKVVLPNPPIYWEFSDVDVNTTKYKSMIPRFLLEACVFVRLNDRRKATNIDNKHKFLRLRMLRCHRELKLEKPITDFSCDSWRKAWHLYCEFGTKGLMVELRCRGGSTLSFKGSKLVKSMVFCWNDLVRAPCITLRRDVEEMRVVASITSPIQAPYLLKCVPDRVTDDSGAMVSDVILKLNNYRPQKGRWLSRTVLDHAGRECFVVRIRVGGGFWRRGAETPCGVNWEERIIEIREGSWSYVAGSIGKAPEKVVGTATPKEPPQQWKAAWLFSTGDEFLINWGSSTSSSDLTFCLKTQQSSDSSIMLLRGRKIQYHEETKSKVAEADDGFVTLVRFTEDNPTGRTTALLNWKLSVVELLPEEDAVLVLLLCVSILRTVSEITKEDVGRLLVRRRLKEAKLGARDWGSVLLHPSSLSSSSDSPYLRPWYLNANKVMAQHEDDGITRQPGFKYSPVEGGDMLYKRGIIT
ncbi:hypothetical protein ES332_D11G326500v1 [Gossypium tomentosum]|uniref:GRPD C-terminal domain-containing protein n=1 Tax=Gossypium tomentosum TaxID=34277 RepID=A0A5D2IW31_GOSTO|nr:hypothetical protein ES332_D11G326500v1 [Gossypium tomentosum]